MIEASHGSMLPTCHINTASKKVSTFVQDPVRIRLHTFSMIFGLMSI
ncbi:MAG: hypothetical protein RI973_2041 [Bacteroidota bacterium]|jgi:hypothetical protein